MSNEALIHVWMDIAFWIAGTIALCLIDVRLGLGVGCLTMFHKGKWC